MNASLALLLLEDILFLGVTFGFLYLRQRGYTVLAVILFAVLLVTNILSFQGYSSLFLVLLPALACLILGISARVFLPRPRITFGTQAARIVIVLFLFLVLILLVLSIGMIVSLKR